MYQRLLHLHIFAMKPADTQVPSWKEIGTLLIWILRFPSCAIFTFWKEGALSNNNGIYAIVNFPWHVEPRHKLACKTFASHLMPWLYIIFVTWFPISLLTKYTSWSLFPALWLPFSGLCASPGNDRMGSFSTSDFWQFLKTWGLRWSFLSKKQQFCLSGHIFRRADFVRFHHGTRSRQV